MMSQKAKNLLEACLKRTKIHNYDLQNVYSNPKGSGYMGEVTFVSVLNKDTGKTEDLVVKAAFDNQQLRAEYPVRRSYTNEINFYTNILPALKDIKKFDFVPDILHHSVEVGGEGIVMKNLKSQDYQCLPIQALLDATHIEMLMATYGRFHAYSFALRHKQAEKYAKLAEECNDSPLEAFCKSKRFSTALEKLCKLGLTYLEQDEQDSAVVNSFKKYVDNPAEILKETWTKTDQHSGIVQGDCWTNNFLFKYYQKEIPQIVRLIDFQWAKTGSPIYDLSYTLYAGTNKEQLDRLEDYLRLYYMSFSTALEEVGCNPNKLYPYSKLKEHWRVYAKYGMMMAFIWQRTKLVDMAQIRDLKTDSSQKQFFPPGFDHEVFRNRIKNIILSMHETEAL